MVEREVELQTIQMSCQEQTITSGTRAIAIANTGTTPKTEYWQSLHVQAKILHGLLHGSKAKDWDVAANRYRGWPRIVSIDEIVELVAGTRILAFADTTFSSTLGEPAANFTGVDVDARSAERLPAFHDVLESLGLLSASFATICEGRDRCKVIVCLASGVARDRANSLGKLILKRAIDDGRFGVMSRKKEVEIFPRLGKGGQCRIGGRSHRAGAGCEIFVDLNGRPIDLATIRPASVDKVRRLTVDFSLDRKQSPRLAPRTNMLCQRPWSYSEMGGTDKIHRKKVDVAREFLRAHGPHGGRLLYMTSMARVRNQSPELSGPSPKNKDRKNPLEDRLLEKTWEYVQREPFGWKPQDLTVRPLRLRSKLCYLAVIEIVRSRGLMRHCFGLSDRDLADYLGLSHQAAGNWVKKAAEENLMVIHDKGWSGPRGLPKLLGLVCEGETPEDVRRAVESDRKLIARRNHLRLRSSNGETSGWAALANRVDIR